MSNEGIAAAGGGGAGIWAGGSEHRGLRAGGSEHRGLRAGGSELGSLRAGGIGAVAAGVGGTDAGGLRTGGIEVAGAGVSGIEAGGVVAGSVGAGGPEPGGIEQAAPAVAASRPDEGPGAAGSGASIDGSRQIVLWRHGRTAWNLEHRFQGQIDIPLDDVGVAQAERAARVLAGLKPTAIIASDLSRATRTAEALSHLTNLPINLDEGLRETYAGTWQGLNDEEIRQRYADEFAAFKRGEPVRRGGGELESEVADRVVPAVLRGLEKVPPGGTLVVATHGGAARVALGKMMGLPEDLWGSLGGLSNCCWSVLGEARRGWRLLEHNAGTLLEPVIGDDE